MSITFDPKYGLELARLILYLRLNDLVLVLTFTWRLKSSYLCIHELRWTSWDGWPGDWVWQMPPVPGDCTPTDGTPGSCTLCPLTCSPALSSLSRNAPLPPHFPLLSLWSATKKGLTLPSFRHSGNTFVYAGYKLLRDFKINLNCRIQ